MHKDLSRPLVVYLQTAFEGVWLSQTDRRGSRKRMNIHVLVLMLNITMDSVAFLVWGKEALCPLHRRGNLQNQWWTNGGWTGAFATLFGSNQPWITAVCETSSATGQPELGTAFLLIKKNVNIEDSFINSLSTLSLMENTWTTSHSLSILREQSTEVSKFQTPDYAQNFRVHSCDPAPLGVELSAHSASDL